MVPRLAAGPRVEKRVREARGRAARVADEDMLEPNACSAADGCPPAPELAAPTGPVALPAGPGTAETN